MAERAGCRLLPSDSGPLAAVQPRPAGRLVTPGGPRPALTPTVEGVRALCEMWRKMNVKSTGDPIVCKDFNDF